MLDGSRDRDGGFGDDGDHLYRLGRVRGKVVDVGAERGNVQVCRMGKVEPASSLFHSAWKPRGFWLIVSDTPVRSETVQLESQSRPYTLTLISHRP